MLDLALDQRLSDLDRQVEQLTFERRQRGAARDRELERSVGKRLALLVQQLQAHVVCGRWWWRRARARDERGRRQLRVRALLLMVCLAVVRMLGARGRGFDRAVRCRWLRRRCWLRLLRSRLLRLLWRGLRALLRGWLRGRRGRGNARVVVGRWHLGRTHRALVRPERRTTLLARSLKELANARRLTVLQPRGTLRWRFVRHRKLHGLGRLAIRHNPTHLPVRSGSCLRAPSAAPLRRCSAALPPHRPSASVRAARAPRGASAKRATRRC